MSRPVDMFGFYIDGRKPYRPTEAQAGLDASRVVKWRQMLSTWEATLSQYPNKVKQRARKGIPNSLRGEVWCLMSGGAALRDGAVEGGEYASLLTRPISRADRYCISLDLHRTYPTHERFASPPKGGGGEGGGGNGQGEGEDAHLSKGQRSLRNVLHAHAAHNPAVGYIQGMGFVAGLLLVYMSEEDAFWTLQAITTGERFRMDEVWAPGLVKYKEIMGVFGELVQECLPSLVAHFKAQGVDHSMYATEWFMSIFTYSSPFSLVVRVWDAFLCEGWKVVYRVALAHLKGHAQTLLGMQLDELMPALKRSIPRATEADPEALMRLSLSIPLTTAGIARHAAAFRRDHAEELRQGVASALADAERKEKLLEETPSAQDKLVIAARLPEGGAGATSPGGPPSPSPSSSSSSSNTQGGFYTTATATNTTASTSSTSPSIVITTRGSPSSSSSKPPSPPPPPPPPYRPHHNLPHKGHGCGWLHHTLPPRAAHLPQ